MASPHADLIKRITGGCLIPVLTFFSESPDGDQPLDLPTFAEHIQWLAKSGAKGIVALGSTGEAVTLTREERDQIVKTARQALDDAGAKELPVIAGVTAHSTREVLSQAASASRSGAEAVLALPPSYYAPSMTKEALKGFYLELAEKSPIPVIIYSWPQQSGGLELSSDDVIEVARATPNIIGIKHTDHNVGKMSRIASVLPSSSFVTMGGSSDYLIGSLAVGCVSNVPGTGNVAPAACTELFRLWSKGKGVSPEAVSLQGKISLAGSAFGSGGVALIKAGTQHYLGYGGNPRRPVPPVAKAAAQGVVEKLAPVMEAERSLGSI